MATPVLPYPDMDFTPLDILTAEEMDEIVANVEYLKTFCGGLADGSNLSDGVIQARKLAPGLSSYSTTERDTGITWVDGKNIYKKTIDLGSLPNTATKTVGHGITGLSRVVLLEGMGYRAADGAFFQLGNTPHPNVNLGTSINVTVNSTSIQVSTGTDRTNVTAYVTLYYTKTS